MPLLTPTRHAPLLHQSLAATTIPTRLLTALAASALMALCAHIALPLPFTPVPTTMQTFGVLLLGMTLGPLWAAVAMVLYLLEGAAGLSVFAPTGLPGLAHLLGPTAGFLFAYPMAAALAGVTFRTLERRIGSFHAATLAGIAGLVPVFSIGALWLGISTRLAAHHTMQLAVLPFLPAEAVKLFLAAAVVTALHRLRQKTDEPSPLP